MNIENLSLLVEEFLKTCKISWNILANIFRVAEKSQHICQLNCETEEPAQPHALPLLVAGRNRKGQAKIIGESMWCSGSRIAPGMGRSRLKSSLFIYF